MTKSGYSTGDTFLSLLLLFGTGCDEDVGRSSSSESSICFLSVRFFGLRFFGLRRHVVVDTERTVRRGEGRAGGLGHCERSFAGTDEHVARIGEGGGVFVNKC